MTCHGHARTVPARAVPRWIAMGLLATGLHGATPVALAGSCAARQLPHVATWVTEDLRCFQPGSGQAIDPCRADAAFRLIEAMVATSERRLERGRSCPAAFWTDDVHVLAGDMGLRMLLFLREVMVRFDLTVPAERRLVARLTEQMASRIDRAIRKGRQAVEGRRVDRYARVLERLRRQLAADIWTIEERALAAGVGPRFSPLTMADVALGLAVDLVDVIAEAARAR